jgi:hypothetical protein
MERAAAVAFANQLRSAREASCKDAEAFEGIVHAIERLGSFLTRSIGDLAKYKDELQKIATTSALAEQVPDSFRSVLTPFSQLFDLLRDSRNDAVHQGAFARHLASHAIELAVILEDALRRSEPPSISDYMVRHPVCAELWQPIGYIRQQMLASSFSFLPVLDQHGQWCVISDKAIAKYLGIDTTERKKRLASRLDATQLTLEPATLLTEEKSLEDALNTLSNAPLLILSKDDPKRLLGIVTAFDLL